MARIALLFALLSAFALGCDPRGPGPHESEHGRYFFWEAQGSSVDFGPTCSDAESFRSSADAFELEEGSFLMYRLADDGQSATAQSCTHVRTSTCEDNDPPLVFDVSGNELTHDAEPRTEAFDNTDCELQSSQRWLLKDRGEAMDMSLTLSFDLVGPAADCDELQQRLMDAAPNGQGFDGCEVTIAVDLVLASVLSGS